MALEEFEIDSLPPTIDVSRHRAAFLRSTEAVRSAVRRENGRETPLGPRAKITRQQILVAADQLFLRDGYSSVTVIDIAAAAGVKLPTLYQYFNGRVGIFAALAGERAIEMMAYGVDEWRPESGKTGLHSVISDYVHIYQKHADFFRAWEEAAHTEPTLSSLRREFNRTYKLRFERAIRAGQRNNLVSPNVAADEAARAITQGLERYCFDYIVFDPPASPKSEEEIAATLTELWAGALGLPGRADT